MILNEVVSDDGTTVVVVVFLLFWTEKKYVVGAFGGGTQQVEMTISLEGRRRSPVKTNCARYVLSERTIFCCVNIGWRVPRRTAVVVAVIVVIALVQAILLSRRTAHAFWSGLVHDFFLFWGEGEGCQDNGSRGKKHRKFCVSPSFPRLIDRHLRRIRVTNLLLSSPPL